MNKLLFAACVALVCGALGAALMVVGGPGHARMEKNDAQRAANLRILGQYYRCNLPVEPSLGDSEPQDTPDRCAGHVRKPDAHDPVTNEEYVFIRSSADQFKVCATFQTDTQPRDRYPFQDITFDGAEGCVVHARTGAGMKWAIQ
jgi:hypothetical protein